jgi:cytochrome c oxidase subunit 2
VAGAFPALEGSKLVLGKQEDQIALLLNGKQGTAMASFKQLTDVELAAVATYTRNAWGNKPEDTIVQPKDITAARK